MITQRYELMVEDPELVEIGQAIVKNDLIIGVIYDVNPYNKMAEVILWEPLDIDFTDNMKFVSATVDDVYDKFEAAMNNASLFVKNGWKSAIKTS